MVSSCRSSVAVCLSPSKVICLQIESICYGMHACAFGQQHADIMAAQPADLCHFNVCELLLSFTEHAGCISVIGERQGQAGRAIDSLWAAQHRQCCLAHAQSQEVQGRQLDCVAAQKCVNKWQQVQPELLVFCSDWGLG